MARRNADSANIDFASLDAEMNEALEVLARGSDKPGKAIWDYVKGVISDRPSVFDEPVAAAWIATEKAQKLIKQGMQALVTREAVQPFADEAAAFYASFPDADDESDGHVAFEYAVAFVALSIIRDLNPGDKLILSAIGNVADNIDELAASIASVAGASAGSDLERELLDGFVAREIDRLRKWRFYEGNEVQQQAQSLAERLASGNLRASDAARARAIATCARWISRSADPAVVDRLLAAANSLAPTEEATILAAFIAARADWAAGLAALAPIDTSARRTAALQMVLHTHSPTETLEWFSAAGFRCEDLDPDGRHVLLTCRLQAQDWGAAYADAIALTANDLETTPATQHFAAMTHLVQVVPEDMRPVIVNGPPLDGLSFPLADDDAALADRRSAVRLFRAAAESALALNSPRPAEASAGFALWLELRDPSTEAEARKQLEALLSDGDRAIAYVPFGLSFGVALDLEAIERGLARQTALQPKGTVEIALARLALASSQSDAVAAADYLARYRDIIVRHLNVPGVLDIEVRMLVAAGRGEEARDRLVQTAAKLDENEIARLEAIITQGPDGPTTADLEAAYRDTPSTVNLAQLVAHLSHQGYSERFFELARTLVTTTRTRIDAERIVRFLLRYDRHDEIAALLDAIPDVITTSTYLRSAQGWRLYRQGRLNDARTVLDALRAERDVADDRALLVNLLIVSGRWPELVTFIEAEWTLRDHRTAEELVGLAQLGAQVGSARTWDLVIAAAAAGEDDPHVLINCYMVAMQLGREDEPQVHQWFARAAELSGDEGPVQSGSLQEIVDQAPDWERHVSDVWDKVRTGEAPLSIAAQLLRRTLLDMQLSPMIANRAEPDPRRRAVIPAFSGKWSEDAHDMSSIACDGSALITLGMLGLVDAVIRRSGMFVPHSTLSWLFEERQKLGFHQPSRIKFAHVLTRAIAAQRLHRFVAAVPPDPALGDLIGRSLAAMLATATSKFDDSRQHVVVRSSPVHRIGSFRGESVNLSAFQACLCSCLAVIDKLAERGQLTQEEEARARTFIARQESRWPGEPVIQDGAHLYLDDLSVSYLRGAGVLEKLHAAGLVAHVSDREIDEAQALIALESHAAAIEEVIEHIRASLAGGIERGDVHLDRIFTGDELKAHPNIAVIQLADRVDTIVCDDRYMNQHRHIAGEAGEAAIWTTLDLLAAMRADKLVSDDVYWQHRTTLRQAGLVHFSTSAEELIAFVGRSKTRDGHMVETGELRAFRENLALAQMRGWLTLPLEAHWLNKLTSDIISTIRAQWSTDISDEDARARSRWLLALADMRNWAGQITEHDGMNLARYGLALAVNSLLLSHFDETAGDTNERLGNWLRDEVVARMKVEEPTVYAWLIACLRSILVDRLNGEGEDDGE